jgi:hypothetical protein
MSELTIPVSIVNVLMTAIADRLKAVLMDDAADDIQAGLVRIGKLQADPTETKITVLIHPGGREFPHALNEKTAGPGMVAPIYEIGGGVSGRSWQGSAFYLKRFVIELSLFFTRENQRARAQEKANAVLSRAVWAFLTMNVPDEVDDFGEQATGQFQVLDHWIEESGGKGTFVWRGEIRAEFMTSLSPV